MIVYILSGGMVHNTLMTVTPRKKPAQQRAKQRVDNIIEATVSLLETTGAASITTHHIARQAGISVASLYQYFPNKEAVIYAVFEKWLSWVTTRFDEVEEQYYLKVTWDVFFDHLMGAVLEKTLFSYQAENQLSRAMRNNPDLAERDRRHGNAVSRRLSGYLKGYGSQWPEQKRYQAGHLLYEMSSMLYNRFGDESIINRGQMLTWGRTMVHALLKECLPKADG